MTFGAGMPPDIGRRGFRKFAFLALCGTALLSACTEATVSAPPPTSETVVPAPTRRPDTLIRQAELRRARSEREKAANAAARTAAEQPASRNMRDYLANVQQALLARGLMRTDDGRSLGPTTADQLVKDFIQTALHDEYTRQDGKLISRAQPAPLRRWPKPVRMNVEFGASVPPIQRDRYRRDVATFAARLQRVTGHPVLLVNGGGNFHIFVVSEEERRALGSRLNTAVPGIPNADVAALVDLAPQNFCTVFAYSRGEAQAYVAAVAVMRAELPDKMWISCVHEELAQGMGLANDSPTARPSIFNDDEEFALLTHHDELLLKMLYDPRLQVGMTEEQATPILYQIANELLAADNAMASN